MGQEDPLEKEMTTHSRYSCLGNPMDRGEWWAASMGWQRMGHNSVIKQQQHIFRYFLKTGFLNWWVFHNKNVTYLTMSNCWILSLFINLCYYNTVQTFLYIFCTQTFMFISSGQIPKSVTARLKHMDILRLVIQIIGIVLQRSLNLSSHQ